MCWLLLLYRSQEVQRRMDAIFRQHGGGNERETLSDTVTGGNAPGGFSSVAGVTSA